MEHPWKQRLQSLEAFGASAALLSPRVALCADQQAVIEGCEGILQYNETLVKLGCGALAVEIEGTALCLNHLSDREICISGRLRCVRFVSG